MKILYRIRCLVQIIVLCMQSKDTKELVKQDLQRCGKNADFAETLVKNPNFRSVYYFRIKNKFLKKLCSIILCPSKVIEIWGDIGGGLRINHKMGCTILANRIGKNCTVLQGVTIGKGKVTEKGELPILGDNVTIYANAVIIGGITIGDNAVIGAGSVVTHDVPTGTVVAGVPAKVIRKLADANLSDVEAEGNF